MMLFDLRTTLIIAGLMSGLMAGVLFAAHHSFPKSVGGLKAWGLGNLFLLLAGLAFAFRGIISDFLSIIVANVLFVAGYWLMWSATRALLDVPNISRVVSRLALLTVALLLLLWTYVYPSFAARSVLIAGLTSLYYICQATSLWRHHRRSLESYFFIFLMWAGFGATLARTVASILMLSTKENGSFLTPSFIQTWYLTTFTILSLLHSMAFFFLATRKLQTELQKVARNDPLTGIYNRRAMMELAELAVENAKRKDQPLSVIICDLDNFKLINDTHGHYVGDEVLCDFSDIVSATKRPADIFARLGGEEFALILQDTDQAQAIAMSYRIHTQLNAPREITIPRYTSSFGISTCRPQANSIAATAEIISALLKRADDAVYAAKNNGRNCIEIAPS